MGSSVEADILLKEGDRHSVRREVEDEHGRDEGAKPWTLDQHKVAKMKMAGLLESDIVVSQLWLKQMMPPSSAKKAPPKHYKDARTNRPRMRRMSSLSGNQKAIRSDFMRLLGMDFQRMLSTSGNVVKYHAKKGAVLAVEYAFPLWERSATSG